MRQGDGRQLKLERIAIGPPGPWDILSGDGPGQGRGALREGRSSRAGVRFVVGVSLWFSSRGGLRRSVGEDRLGVGSGARSQAPRPRDVGLPRRRGWKQTRDSLLPIRSPHREAGMAMAWFLWRCWRCSPGPERGGRLRPPSSPRRYGNAVEAVRRALAGVSLDRGGGGVGKDLEEKGRHPRSIGSQRARRRISPTSSGGASGNHLSIKERNRARPKRSRAVRNMTF